MNRPLLIAISLVIVSGACARQAVVTSAPPSSQPPVAGPTPPPARLDVRALATINDVANTTIGSASFSDTPAGLLVTINVTGLGIGPHGVHLHSVGSCVAPTFVSAGDHFNPSDRHHGFRNSGGHHAGDMPNLLSPPAGTYRVQFLLDDVRLTGRGGLVDGDGASIVIHGAEDDLITDPAGNSGGRLACGVIRLTTP